LPLCCLILKQAVIIVTTVLFNLKAGGQYSYHCAVLVPNSRLILKGFSQPEISAYVEVHGLN